MSCPFCGFQNPAVTKFLFGKTARRASLVVPGCFFARNPLGWPLLQCLGPSSGVLLRQDGFERLPVPM